MDVSVTVADDYGYTRDAATQTAFDAAAQWLRGRALQQRATAPGRWPYPVDDRHPLIADLALEGGGVKGVGIVGALMALDEAGYSFRGVAGTSVGSIAASLVASITRAGKPMSDVRNIVTQLDFTKFAPSTEMQRLLGHFGNVGTDAGAAAELTHKMGLHDGGYLRDWLEPLLTSYGVRTFGDLRLTTADDPERFDVALPAERRYRVVFHVSDITRGRLVRLPWDFRYYGTTDVDPLDVVAAVRASMSIPFFFEPVTYQATVATVDVPAPDGTMVTQTYEPGAVTWVDGGMLRNFPIDAFDRVDDLPPRWPTIGVKLSSLPTKVEALPASTTSVSEAVHCLHTMMGEWDTYSIDESTAARSIFIDNAGIKATQFELSLTEKKKLFANGVAAATRFIIEMGGGPAPTGVPTTRAEILAKVRARRDARPATT